MSPSIALLLISALALVSAVITNETNAEIAELQRQIAEVEELCTVLSTSID